MFLQFKNEIVLGSTHVFGALYNYFHHFFQSSHKFTINLFHRPVSGQFTSSLSTYREVQTLYFSLKSHLHRVNGDDLEIVTLLKGVSEGSISGDIERLELLHTTG
jgi:hypothetical protein